MNIAIITTEFPALSETFIINHVLSLLDRDHTVSVFAFRSNPATCSHAIVNARLLGTLVRPIDPSYSESNFDRIFRRLKILLQDGWRQPAITMRSLDPRLSLRSAFGLSVFACSRGFAQARKFDIAHCHFGWSGIVGAKLKRAKAFDAKLVVTFHGADVSANWGVGSETDRRIMFKTSDWFTANTNFIREEALSLGAPADRCSIWHMGVDVDTFKFRERHIGKNETVRILTIGRLVEKKGIEYVLRALGCLGPRDGSIEYHVVGDGPLRGHLENLSKSLCPYVNVVFHGSCSTERVQELLNGAHFFVLASVTAANGDREGQPVSLIEAQAVGLPVISTLHAGIPEAVLDGQSGYLVAERDVAALVDRLTFLIGHPELWPAMGRAGRRHVENKFSLAKCTDVVTGLYEQLIHG